MLVILNADFLEARRPDYQQNTEHFSIIRQGNHSTEIDTFDTNISDANNFKSLLGLISIFYHLLC
jgi:hypothetical protein